MKYFIQFYHLRNGSFVEGTGDRQIIRVDGRLSLSNMKQIGLQELRSREYDGFRVGRGHRLDNLFWLTATVITGD